MLFNKIQLIGRFRLKNDLPVLVSHFSLFRDERKRRESARVSHRKKKGRENSFSNRIGLSPREKGDTSTQNDTLTRPYMTLT